MEHICESVNIEPDVFGHSESLYILDEANLNEVNHLD